MVYKRADGGFILQDSPFTMELGAKSSFTQLKNVFNLHCSEHFSNWFDSGSTFSNPRMNIFTHVDNYARKTKMLTKQPCVQLSHMKKKHCCQPTMQTAIFINIQWVLQLPCEKTETQRVAQQLASAFAQISNSAVMVEECIYNNAGKIHSYVLASTYKAVCSNSGTVTSVSKIRADLVSPEEQFENLCFDGFFFFLIGRMT